MILYEKVSKWKLTAVRLLEDGGPLDLSKGDGVIGEGGVEGVESRWLETVDSEVREAYNRAKGKLIVFTLEPKTDRRCRLAVTIPSDVYSHRYHTFPIPVHSRKGCLSLGVRTGL